jgi:hypothetical protein
MKHLIELTYVVICSILIGNLLFGLVNYFFR